MKRFIVLSLVISFYYSVYAGVNIKGVFLDGKINEYLEFVNVQLLDADSIFISGTISDGKGYFELENITKGDYILCASFVGYDKLYINISNIDRDLNVGEINMIPTSLILEGLTVTGNSRILKSDRQIIFPTDAQIKVSPNGLVLLKNLHLSRLIINPIDNSIKLSTGDDVQLRINGVEVSQVEIVSLRPADILKVEYYDDPGARYCNAGAVLNYIVKRKESGGNFSGDLSNGISLLGYGENTFAGKYNHKNSEFSANFYWGRRDIKWTRENHELFNLPQSDALFRKEIGEPTRVKYNDLNISLNYSLQKADRYLLSLRFRNNHNDSPHSMTDRKSVLYQEEEVSTITDYTSSSQNSPSLDLYYQVNLKQKQQLIFNVVGTYLSSKNTRRYNETLEDNQTHIFSDIKGEKHSLIVEGIYEKAFASNQKLSGGIKHTQAYLNNKYLGDFENNVGMNIAETYGYVEYQLGHKKFNYTLSLGAMRTYNSQEKRSNDTFIFRPSLSIAYHILPNLYVRYSGFISGYSPSLSDLNDISQSIDPLQVRRGNPNLKSVKFYSNTLAMSWQKEIFAIDLHARYSYDDKPVMESVNYENGRFIRSNENHRNFHRINLQASIQVLPFKEYIVIKVSPFLNRYISNGNNYTHTHTNVGLRGSIMAMYKNWSLMAEMNTSNHVLWGETINKEEKLHSIMVGYNKERWSLSLGVLNPFTKRYELEIENKSSLAPFKHKAYSTKLSPVFLMNFSFNLDFGRIFNIKEKRLHNEDRDSGILSGKK